MLDFQQFKEYYSKYGKVPNQLQKPKNKLNKKQLESVYKRYCKGEKKREMRMKDNKIIYKKDEKLEEAYTIVDKRDKYECQLLNKFYKDDLIKFFKGSLRRLSYMLDHAHVFGKGAYPQLQYDPDNIVLLNRFSHSMLDTCRNPITGEQITKEDKEKWWKFIITEKQYNKLLKKINKEKE